MTVYYRYLTEPGYQWSANDGTPLAYGKLKFTLTGTTTDADVFADTLGSTNLGSEVTLDAYGRKTICLDPTKQYRVVVKDANGVDIPSYGTFDNITGIYNPLLELTTSNGLAFNDNTGIYDKNNVEVLTVLATSSAINYMRISNSATGNGPLLETRGSDTNISQRFACKGTGAHAFASPATFASTVAIAGAAAVTGALSTSSTLTVGGTSSYTGLMTASGGIKNTQSMSFHTLLTSTSCATATVTKILYNTNTTDTNSIVNLSTDRVVITVAGIYKVDANVAFNTMNGTGNLSTSIYKNGSAIKTSTSSCPFANAGVSAFASIIIALGVGDYLEVYASQGGGGTESTVANDSYIQGHLITPT